MNFRQMIAGTAMAVAAVGSAHATVPTFSGVSGTLGSGTLTGGSFSTGSFVLAPTGLPNFSLLINVNEGNRHTPVAASVYFNNVLLTTGEETLSTNGAKLGINFDSLVAGLYRVDVTGTAGAGVVVKYSAAVAAVPEPESVALLLAGLGVVGFSLSRRKA